jgi:hypothetical protein
MLIQYAVMGSSSPTGGDRPERCQPADGSSHRRGSK